MRYCGSAIEIARKYDARIFALHVVDPAPCVIGTIDYDFGLIVQALEEHGQEIVTRVTDVLDAHSLSAETRMVTLPITGFFGGPGDRVGCRHVGCRSDSSRRAEFGLVALAERRRCLGGTAPHQHADSDRLRQSQRRFDAPCRNTLDQGTGR